MDIIRAWKDPEYRESLNETELAALPEHPAGLIELTDVELGAVAGGHQEQTGWRGGWCEITKTGTRRGRCHCECNKAAAILLGVQALNMDAEITQEERESMQNFSEMFHNNPILTAEQIDGITQTAESLQEYLPADEWAALMHSVHAIQEAGALTEEQVAEVTEFVESLSEE